jgi:glycosyltransferase involved in cell wall biosynthesis
MRPIGIAMAAYNPPAVVFEKQLQSIIEQTLENWICIITVDSDVDNTLEMHAVRRQLQDRRFIVFSNSKRLGHKKNFELALQKTLEHDVAAVCFSDQDDIWYPNKLAETFEEYLKLPPLSLVHTNMDLLYEDGKRALVPNGWDFEKRGVSLCAPGDLVVRNNVAGCSLMMDPELGRKFPIVPNEFSYHDHWYAALASCFGEVRPLNKALYAYRQHRENVAGITEYRGFFDVKGIRTFHEVAQGIKARWEGTVFRAYALQKIGYTWPAPWRVAFFSKWDCGLVFVLLALRAFLRKDKMLCRAFIIRAVGKIMGP